MAPLRRPERGWLRNARPDTLTVMSRKNLSPGDEAPPFALPGTDGQTHALADHLGKRLVVLAWYPKAATPG